MVVETPFEAVVVAREDAAAGQALLRLVAGDALPQTYRVPGQYVAVQTPDGTGFFALANDPGDFLELLVKPLGPAAAWLFAAQPGSRFHLSAAQGDGFDASDVGPGTPTLLLGGGTGVTPLRPLWRRLVRQEARVEVWYGAVERDALAFRGELDKAAHKGTLKVRYFVDQGPRRGAEETGRATDALVAGALPYAQLKAYLCGPDAMVAAARERLTSLGVPPAAIRTNL